MGLFKFNYNKHLHWYILYRPSSFPQEISNVVFTWWKIITEAGLGIAIATGQQYINYYK